MSEVTVAVIVVSYRSAQLTIDCLHSLQPERATPGVRLRVIVVDNASGDIPELERAVQRHGWSDWVELIDAPRNGGFAYGNNLGSERAYSHGAPSYVYLLNPDAQARPGAIGELVRFLEAHPDAGIAGSSIENSDGSSWPFAFRFPSLLSEINDGLQFGLVTRLLRRWVVVREMGSVAQAVDWVSGASLMIRAAVFDAIGGLDENFFLYFEETDFCRRARAAGFSTWYVPQSRVMHGRGQITQVASEAAGPLRRLPAYWFESRRRYFALAFGTSHAMAIDAVALAAYSLGWLKRLALLRRRTAVPHMVRDLARHSLLWPANRALPPPRCFSRTGADESGT
jgi:hypothetical protein